MSHFLNLLPFVVVLIFLNSFLCTSPQASLIREVFAPTPVLVVLNKADVASADQLKQLLALLHQHQFTNCKGDIFGTIVCVFCSCGYAFCT